MARTKRKKSTSKEAYKRVRKPVPPPGKVIEDRRRKASREVTRRELERELPEREG